MSLVKCPSCGSTVSDKADSCPHCGYVLADNANVPSNLMEQNGTVTVETLKATTKLGAGIWVMIVFLGLAMLGFFYQALELGDYATSAASRFIKWSVFGALIVFGAPIVAFIKRAKDAVKLAQIAWVTYLLCFLPAVIINGVDGFTDAIIDIVISAIFLWFLSTSKNVKEVCPVNYREKDDTVKEWSAYVFAACVILFEFVYYASIPD